MGRLFIISHLGTWKENAYIDELGFDQADQSNRFEQKNNKFNIA